MAVQTFNPETVLVSESKEGVLYDDFNTAVMSGVAENSLVMQLGEYVDMDDKEKTIQVMTDGVSAYWVNETEKIQTDKPELVPVTIRAHKLGIILLSSREALNYTWSRYFEDMKPEIVKAFNRKIDEAGILNVNNPFANSVDEAATASGNVTVGDINYDNILALQDTLYDDDVEPNAIISKVTNNTALRGARDSFGNGVFDRANGTVDGITTVNLKSDNMPKGTIYAGDFSQLKYGVPFNISYKISEEGQISTVTNEDGSPINLFEQEMIALRATMEIAVAVVKDGAFAKLAPTPEP